MLNYRNSTIFLILTIFWIGISLSIQYLFLDNNILFYQTYGEQLTLSSIDRILNLSRKWQWFGYIFLPIIILLRVFYLSVFLYIGLFFYEVEVEFGKIFKVSLLADFIFVLSTFTKLVILIFFKQVNTLDDLQFQPLSIMELLNKKTVDPLFVYPLSLINIFELGYFLILAWLLVGVINESNEKRPVKFGKSLQLVTASYGSGLLLWVLLVMFITLNLS